MIELTNETFDNIIDNSDHLVVVDFWAEWCGPCKKFTPVLEALAEKHKGAISFYKARVETNNKAVSDYGIRSLPTLMFFKHGKDVATTVGAIPAEKVEATIASLQ